MRSVCLSILLILHFFCANIFTLTAQSTANREAGTASIKTTFTYGNNLDYAGQNTVLKADLYKPALLATGLPLVIIYHGGGYASGDRNVASLKVFSDYFLSNNISTVIPDFRQGWYESSTKPLCVSATPDKYQDAALRAYQDNRALIRYCKANAALMGIDSNKIFLFGISSGGFLVLHHLYIDDNAIGMERIKRLGSLDGQDNTLNNTTDVAGIISVVGGFYKNDVPIVKKIPTLLFNNTCDGAVDFFNGWLGNCSNTVRSYGPGIFTKILEQYNSPYNLHVFCGYNHGFNTLTAPQGGDAEAVAYVNKKSVAFIRQTIQGNTLNTSTSIASDSVNAIPLGECRNFETFYWCKKDSLNTNENSIYLSPNPITCELQPKLNIRHPQDEQLLLQVVSENGSIITQKNILYKTSESVIYLNVSDFSIGVNVLLVRNSSGKILYKTKVMRYCEF